MKRSFLYSAFIMALTVACTRSNAGTETASPSIDVAHAVTDSITVYNTYPGTLTANNSVDIVARVSGSLTSKRYSDGEFVKKGTLLFTIEDSKYRDAVNQARAALETAKSDYEYSKTQYSSMLNALSRDAVAQIQVNKAKNTMEQSAANIKNAEAALQTALDNLGYCHITAPFDGHITAPAFSVGAYINGEVSPVRLATLYEDAVVRANFNIDDKGVQEMLKGKDALDLKLDSIPMEFAVKTPHNYSGKLSYISPEVDPSTGTLQIIANIDNPDGELRDGMYVNVKFPIMTLPHATLIKDASISTDQLGKYVYSVTDYNTVVYTPVTIGETVQDSMRVILSGLSPDDRYVTKALLKVREGMKITPVMTE